MDKFLETKRLIIKLTSPLDFEEIFELRTDPDVQKYTTQGPQTREDVQRFIDTVIPYQEKHGHGMGSVFEKSSGCFIGQAGIFHIGHYDRQPEIEIGYRFHKKYWGKGYATEVTKALVSWGFKNLNVEVIVAFVESENIPSRRVLEKCGFNHLGLKHCYYGELENYEVRRTYKQTNG